MNTKSFFESKRRRQQKLFLIGLVITSTMAGCYSNTEEQATATNDAPLTESKTTRPGSPGRFIQDCNDPQSGVSCVDLSPEIQADLHGHGYPYYIGHAEPAVLFHSSSPRSASDMQWRISLPSTDPTPTQNGNVVANFELFPTFWIGQVMCDPTSNPFGSCTPASDSNDPATAGSAFMELQFYPPGIARSQTSWSVSITIDSFHSNVACDEPITWANITADGNPNSAPFLMSSGDTLVVTIKDTSAGVRVDINDITANRSGFMVASGANGFVHNAAINAVFGSCSLNHATLCASNTDCPAGQGTCSFCQTEPFDFHPLYATASLTNVLNWGTLHLNVGLAFEIGHFELCGNSSCSVLPDGDSDDTDCFPVRGIGGCQSPDLDQDGVSYQTKWPDGTSVHPGSIVIGSPNQIGVGPLSAGTPGIYGQSYDTVRFNTTESTATAFYPFYSAAGLGRSCKLNFGNDIPGVTSNDFSQASQYTNQPRGNPCPPDFAWLVPTLRTLR